MQTFRLTLLSLALLQTCLQADDFNIGTWTSDHVAMIPSAHSDGSSILLSTDNPHSGKQCLKLVYKIENVGYAEYNLNPKLLKPEIASATGGPLKILFWIRGDPGANLSPIAIRLIDHSGEVFQYTLVGSETAMLSPNWVLYTTSIDLNKPALHFAGNHDGVIHYPAQLLSVVLESKQSGTNSGCVYIDDLQWEATSP